MLRPTVLLLLWIFFIAHTESFKIIGQVETPHSGLLKSYERGGGKDFETVKHAVKGERGDRGYEAKHVEEKGIKGVHDNEDHKKSLCRKHW
ncbi:hypothetical protein NQ318_000495 [Aromia moschata]|uniref:Uncharacterized protein n=1 Tax=Aromia moschata TaxID=1265417 RepID=A0AAV8YEC3_9CUCU|nr:hypothetical protein NQ318_000495 [Aromia moschata]